MVEKPRDFLNDAKSWKIEKRDFRGADLASVHPSVWWFERCNFSGADLRFATFPRGAFKLCDFSRANLAGASFRDAHFAGCDFRDADLSNSDLSGATFTYASAGTPDRPTDLTGALLDGAKMNGVEMERVVGWDDD